MTKNIFQENARIEQNNGLHFYEQDIILLDYIYKGDFVADIIMSFTNPGFGLVLSKYNSHAVSLEDTTDMMLFRIGHYEYNVYRRQYLTMNRISNASCQATTKEEPQHFRFRLSGRTMYAFLVTDDSETMLSSFILPVLYPDFYIGLYSNKGNTITDFEIYDNRPQFWFVNIENTNGGRASFAADTFLLEKAEKPIEVEEQNIELPPGKYWLNYRVEEENDLPCDIEGFLFDSEDPDYKAPEKSLLDEDRSFMVEENQKVNIFFQGKNGRVSEICIKDDPRQSYVSTEEGSAEREGSYIAVKLEGLKKIQWKGVIEDIPNFNLNEKPPYSIIAYGEYDEATLEALTIEKNLEYSYTFEKTGSKWKFTIENVFEKDFEYIEDEKLKIFFNISGYINEFIITTATGEVINILTQRTMKKYVPSIIESPILVTDNDEEPFELSASYRELPDGKYIFTNWEREYFEAERDIYLEYPINGDNIIIYGIEKKLEDLSNIYKIENTALINSINLLTTSYDTISGDNYKIIDPKILRFNADIAGAYELFIIDYLKDDSYAINLTESGDQYEVDISSTKDVIKLMYDLSEDGQIRHYKILDTITPKDNRYITLKRGDILQ